MPSCQDTKTELYENFHRNTRSQKYLVHERNFTYRHILKTINKYLKSPKDVLDIGCGAGTLCLYYANKGNNVMGIDISKQAIKSATESAELLKLSNVTYQQMNFPKEVPNQKFDFIIFTEVIEHLEDDDFALKQIYKLLRPGGILFLTTPSINAPLHKLGMAKEFDKKVGHLRRYTLEELCTKTEKQGFTVLETKKTEGIVRNFLFLNPIAGKSIRFIKFFLSDLVSFIDFLSLRLFGESNLFIVAQKPNK